MSRYTRTGNARPEGGGLELAIWYLMRLTGLALFVLALTHFLIVHLVVDPSVQTADWIAQIRWSSLFWRAFDWLLLMMVLFHGFMGVRIVVVDYTRGGRRSALLMGLYLLGILLFVMGTTVVMTMPVVPRAG
jgi:succinate dehydrogenase / fumarate reductase membrane anchor subunit